MDLLMNPGPIPVYLSHPEAVELLENLKGDCELEIADESAKARWIWKNGKWEPLPSGLVGGIATPLFTFSDKLRLLGEPFRKKGDNPNETLAELVLRRMGKSFPGICCRSFHPGNLFRRSCKTCPQICPPKIVPSRTGFWQFYWRNCEKSAPTKNRLGKESHPRNLFSERRTWKTSSRHW